MNTYVDKFNMNNIGHSNDFTFTVNSYLGTNAQVNDELH